MRWAHTHTHAHAHASAHTHTHAHTHKHTHTHTHTHTQAHAQLPVVRQVKQKTWSQRNANKAQSFVMKKPLSVIEPINTQHTGTYSVDMSASDEVAWAYAG